MAKAFSLILGVAATVSGCASGRGAVSDAGFNSDLSAKPVALAGEEAALIRVLAEARSTNGSIETAADATKVRRYVLAGFTLSDIYCDEFFRWTNRQARRRRYTRNVTNDAGTLVNAILGFSGVPTGVVSGVAAGFSGADSAIRNYDDAFLVAPDLSNVRTLVSAAQDGLRRETFQSGNAPADYMTGRSTVIRYAGLCSYLGMQELLNRAVNQQTTQLRKDSDSPPQQGAGVQAAARPAGAPNGQLPAVAPPTAPPPVPEAKPNSVPKP